MLDTPTIILRAASARPASWNADTKTIDAVIASNAPVARRDTGGEFLEILDPKGADLSALIGASVLDSHRADGVRSVLGVVEAARVIGDEIIASLRMSTKPDVADIVRDIGDGILRNLSVGYDVSSWRDGTDPITKKRTRTATAWRPREVSFVGISADSNAKTRNHPMDTNQTTERPAINRAIRELAQRAGATALADDLIDRQVTVEEARSAILDDILQRGSIKISAASNHSTMDNPEFFRNAIVDGLYTRIDPTHKPSEAGRQYAGASTADIARAVLQRNGISTTGLGASSLITRALESTSDYAAVMVNALDKSLRVAYEAAGSGLKEISRETTAVDFRPKQRIMLDSTGIKLQPVSETGEFRRASMVDTKASYSVATYGDIIALSRQLLVNDDLNAFGDVSRRLGIAAAQFEAQQLVDLLTANGGLGPVMDEDGLTMFHADHNNYVSSGAAPSVSTLSAARLAMRHQVGVGGGLIHVEPSVLVVGAELETAAEQLITEIRPVVVSEVNPFSKLTKLVVEPRLPAYGWYLAAEPGVCDGIEYAYLQSSPGPQLQSELGFRVDGLMVRVRLDWGCGAVDFRSWQYNAGH